MRHLIVAIDFTGSNADSGQETYGGMHLHHIEEYDHLIEDKKHQGWTNPYLSSLQAVGETMFGLNNSGGSVELIGFGDIHSLSSPSLLSALSPNGGGSLEIAKLDYKKFTGDLIRRRESGQDSFYGPTTFAPAIRYATHRARTRGEYVILVIITDGKVDGNYRGVDSHADTLAALNEAGQARAPLSIIAVGVGDGNTPASDEYRTKFPDRNHKHWGYLHEFEDLAKAQGFEDFHFVKHKEFYRHDRAHHEKFNDLGFVKAAFRKIPYQIQEMVSKNRLFQNKNMQFQQLPSAPASAPSLQTRQNLQQNVQNVPQNMQNIRNVPQSVQNMQNGNSNRTEATINPPPYSLNPVQ